MARVSSGTVFRRKGTRNWSICFRLDGREIRETARTEHKAAAVAFLRRRTKEAKLGSFVPVSERITFAEMHQLLLDSYLSKKNKTNPSRFVEQLAKAFGNLRGDEINETRIRQYSRRRLDSDGVTPATLRRELAILQRMLRVSNERLPRLPLIEMPRVHNERQGFFDEDHILVLLPKLPPHARNLVEFLYLTGWRCSEAFRLEWRDIDWDRCIVLLRDSKSREPRIFPFKYHPRLEALLKRQRDQVSSWERDHLRSCPTVFHWRGRTLKKIRRSWERACRDAGLQGRLIHDLRRSAVRNLIKANVPQIVAMQITGHKTDASFRRYLIIDEEQLAEAAGTVAAWMEQCEREKASTGSEPNASPDEPELC